MEAMVRHGKKLSEGKEGEGGVSRQSSLTPFHLAFGMILSEGGRDYIMFIYVLEVFPPTPVSKQTLKIESNRLKGMVNAKKSLI